MNEKEQQVKSYFDIQRQYYEFLKEKLGVRFTGESDNANGRLKTTYGRYPLPELDDRLKFREIALECMAGKTVFVRARRGRTYMSGRVDFPYVIEGEGSENEFAWALWNFNEVIGVTIADETEEYEDLTIAERL